MARDSRDYELERRNLILSDIGEEVDILSPFSYIFVEMKRSQSYYSYFTILSISERPPSAFVFPHHQEQPILDLKKMDSLPRGPCQFIKSFLNDQKIRCDCSSFNPPLPLCTCGHGNWYHMAEQTSLFPQYWLISDSTSLWSITFSAIYQRG
jgi:hypothetical protein